MQVTTEHDHLIQRAEAAIREARRLQAELANQVAVGWAIRRKAEQSRVLAEGLNAAPAISLLVREAR